MNKRPLAFDLNGEIMFKQIKKFLRYLVGEKLSEEAFLRKNIQANRINLLKYQSQKEYYAALEAYLIKTAVRKSAERLEDMSLQEAQDNREYFAAMEVYYAKVIKIQIQALEEAEARAKTAETSEPSSYLLPGKHGS